MLWTVLLLQIEVTEKATLAINEYLHQYQHLHVTWEIIF